MDCYNNSFFKWSDSNPAEVEGFFIPPEWWSRRYEYSWAINYARSDNIVADMGCGWMPRPFKDMLAKKAKVVWAVDRDSRVANLRVDAPSNLEIVVDDITQLKLFGAGHFDKIFCISVLEDLEDKQKVLETFKKVLRPHESSRIIFTFDVPYDGLKPVTPYPGVDLQEFVDLVWKAGLDFDGCLEMYKNDIVFNSEFNLCCFHCVLKIK